MVLELMPDGLTFKKLTKIQTEALDRYYKRGKPSNLDELLQSPLLPSIISGTVASAFLVAGWAYLKDQPLPTFDESANWLGGGVGGIIAKAYDNNPKTPEMVTLPDGKVIGPLSRCQRWENDAATLIQTDKLSTFFDLPILKPQFTILKATKSVHIIKNMKREGCPKPTAFSQTQWDDVTI
jgi:hypothetical protein